MRQWFSGRGAGGGGFFRGGFQAHGLAAPDFFQLVVLAEGRLHDVGDGGAAVHDDLFAVVFAFGQGLAQAAFKIGRAHV